MFFIAYILRTGACVCRTSKNCKSLFLQVKCNIEIFLSPEIGIDYINRDRELDAENGHQPIFPPQILFLNSIFFSVGNTG